MQQAAQGLRLAARRREYRLVGALGLEHRQRDVLAGHGVAREVDALSPPLAEEPFMSEAPDPRAALARQLKLRASYYGGAEVYRPGYNGQSYERGRAAAAAYAQVLNEAGIKAYAGSRMD